MSINVKQTYQFKLSVQDDKNDACKTANIKIYGPDVFQVGYNVSRQLYSWAFVKRVKSFVHVNISFESNNSSIEIVQGLLGLNVKRGWSAKNVNNKFK